MPLIFPDLMPGEPLPQLFRDVDAPACGLTRHGFFAVFRADHLSPADIEAFASRPMTFSVAGVHPLFAFLELRFETRNGKKSHAIPFPHSAPLHEENPQAEPMLTLLKRDTPIHIVAFQGSPKTIVAVRRATLDERTAWHWRSLAENQLRTADRFPLGDIWRDVEMLLGALPQPLPARLVRASQVMPAPTQEEMPFCIRGAEWAT